MDRRRRRRYWWSTSFNHHNQKPHKYVPYFSFSSINCFFFRFYFLSTGSVRLLFCNYFCLCIIYTLTLISFFYLVMCFSFFWFIYLLLVVYNITKYNTLMFINLSASEISYLSICELNMHRVENVACAASPLRVLSIYKSFEPNLLLVDAVILNICYVY